MKLTLIRRVSAVMAVGLGASALTAAVAAASPPADAASTQVTSTRVIASPFTTTPIKHVVVIIAENHSFDNVFATYRPPDGQHIWNLLSEGIVTKSGSPGPNFAAASQYTATNTAKYTLTPVITGEYTTLPQPNTTYVATACDGLPANSPDTRFRPLSPTGRFRSPGTSRTSTATWSTRARASVSCSAPTWATRSTASTRCGSRASPTTTGSPPG